MNLLFRKKCHAAVEEMQKTQKSGSYFNGSTNLVAGKLETHE